MSHLVLFWETTKLDNYGTTILVKTTTVFLCSTFNQKRRRFRQISGRIEPSRHAKIYQTTASWHQMGVHLLSNVTFYVNNINDYPIGASVLLPDYVLRNPGVVALITGSNGIYNDDDLCLFRWLAVHRGAPVSDVESPAKTYVQQYLQHTRKSPNKFKGVAIEDLQNIEIL